MNTDRLKVKALEDRRHLSEPPVWVYGLYTGVREISTHIASVYIYQDTLCQCTGLKDSNGDLIYEGDLLSHFRFDVSRFKVYWEQDRWVFRETKEDWQKRKGRAEKRGGRAVGPIVCNYNPALTLTGKNIHDPK